MADESKVLLGEAYQSWAEAQGEGAAQKTLRRRGSEAFAATPLPLRSRHLWRYTDPSLLIPGALDLAPASESSAASLLEPPEGGALVRLRPGHQAQVCISDSAEGLELTPLSSANGLTARLGDAVPPDHGFFEALNAAAFSGGVALRVARGVALQGPVHVIVEAGEPGATSLPRLLVAAEAGAELLVIEEHVGGGVDADAHSLAVSVSELFVGANAHLRHVLLQNWADGTRGHITTRAQVERDGSLKSVVASLGGALAKLDLGADLLGPGANSDIRGFSFADDGQHLDHHTRHRHASGQTHSNIDFRQALSGRGRAVYTGLIRVDEDAAGAEALQENRNLLLSKASRVDTIPELEILTDDVSCSHGATVAPLEPEPLFYLQSRGVAPDDAVRLIVRGFLEEIIAAVPEGARDGLESGLAERLAGLDAEQVLASAAALANASSGRS